MRLPYRTNLKRKKCYFYSFYFICPIASVSFATSLAIVWWPLNGPNSSRIGERMKKTFPMDMNLPSMQSNWYDQSLYELN